MLAPASKFARLQRVLTSGKVCTAALFYSVFLLVILTNQPAYIPRLNYPSKWQASHILWPSRLQRSRRTHRNCFWLHRILGKIPCLEARSAFCSSPLITPILSLYAGKMGTQVIVPYRDEDDARLLKPMGDLGQIVRMVRFISDSGGPKNQLIFLKCSGMGPP